MSSDTPARFAVDFTGAELLGHYRVGQAFASGGMGTIYEGTNTNLGTKVVVKVPHVRLLAEPGFAQRFAHEIEDLVRLRHPGIVRIQAQGVHQEVPFFVLDYLEGGSLATRLQALGGQGMSVAEVLTWLSPMAQALDFIHGKGVIHRDVKPGNILFDQHGHVFLSDFGIAKAMDPQAAQLTSTGSGLGSPQYMAPEQGMGRTLTPAADQYALASTVYEALAGAPPFEAATPIEVVFRKESEPAPHVRDRAQHVSPGAANALMRALAHDPEQRWPTCVAFVQAFVKGMGAEADLTRSGRTTKSAKAGGVRMETSPSLVFRTGQVRPPAGTRTRPASPRRRWPLVAGLIALVVGGGAWALTAGPLQHLLAPPPDDPLPVTAQAPATGTKAPPAVPPATPLVLAITEPADGALLASGRVRVGGTWSGPRVPPRLWAGETALRVVTGRFEGFVDVAADGPATIHLRGEGTAPLEGWPQRAFAVDSKPPEVQITQPEIERSEGEAESIHLEGRIVDAHPKSLRVSDCDCPFQADGSFSFTRAIAPGATVTVTVEAVDAAGHRSGKVSRTFVRPVKAKPAQETLTLVLAAAREGRWADVGLLLEKARGQGLLDSEVPPFVKAGWERWRAPPRLTVYSPGEGAVVRGLEVEVSGSLATERASDRLFVDGQEVAVQGGLFSHRRKYEQDGEVEIVFLVKDGADERERKALKVTLKDPRFDVPFWAKVAPAQIQAARERRLPVAFENSIGMRFVLIPSGRFRMGSPISEEGRRDDETQHTVTLTKPYYLAIHETTNGQYRRYDPKHVSEPDEAAAFGGDRQPVVSVSHSDATAFVRWLRNQDKERSYRLPTEAEWEHACRAGTTTRFWWGDAMNDAELNASFSLGATVAVGSYRPNPWGLYDVHGNVYEFVSDGYGPHPSGAQTDPTGPRDGRKHLARGGCWA